jgi:hypothetical protein
LRKGETMKILLKRGSKTIRCRWTTNHPASHYGLGVILMPDGEVLDGFNFMLMSADGWQIETDDPEKVRGALGLHEKETTNETHPRQPRC